MLVNRHRSRLRMRIGREEEGREDSVDRYSGEGLVHVYYERRRLENTKNGRRGSRTRTTGNNVVADESILEVASLRVRDTVRIESSPGFELSQFFEELLLGEESLVVSLLSDVVSYDFKLCGPLHERCTRRGSKRNVQLDKGPSRNVAFGER